MRTDRAVRWGHNWQGNSKARNLSEEFIERAEEVEALLVERGQGVLAHQERAIVVADMKGVRVVGRGD